MIGGLILVLLFLALVVAPVVLCKFKSPETNLGEGWGVSTRYFWGVSTRYFLVLLRLAIGWHFLWEGLDKFKSAAWSSEAYLREASGPMAPWFRGLAGDDLVERLTLASNNQFPEALAADWSNYIDQFKAHHSLTAEETKMAELVFRQSMSRTLTWLTADTKLIARPLPQGAPLMVPMTIPERLADLQKKEEQARNIEDNIRPNFGDTTFAPMLELKGQARRIRAELRAELNKQTADMKRALADVVSGGTKMPCTILGGVAGSIGLPADLGERKVLIPISEPVGKPINQWSRLEWSDHIVKYGLVTVGILLLIGLLTRTACVAGALFLLMFFLAMPPFPGWPENPRAEGHYLFINKNIIEMLALLALATTRSGRWAGLDGLVQFLNPRRYRKNSDMLYDSSPERTPVAHAPGSPVQTSLVSTEKSHGP